MSLKSARARISLPRRTSLLVVLCLSLAALFVGRYVSAASTLYVNPNGVCGGNAPCFTTIQAAINAAVPGDTIQVAAATYAEQININKTLTLLGPNANINPNTGTRAAEAVIVPTASDPLNTSFTGPLIVRLSADNITFNGFTLDGDNPSLTSGVVFNGVDVDAEIGIYGTDTSNSRPVIVNNIVKNLGENAIWLSDASTSGPKTAGGQISANKVDNCIGRFGQGIKIANNAWVDILDNVVTRVRSGIVTENFDGTPPTHPASVIAYNTVSSFRIGIRHNNQYVYSDPGFTIQSNSVTSYVQSVRPPQVTAIETPPTAYQAIRVESIQVGAPVLVAHNYMTGNRAAMIAAGYTRVEGINVTNNLTTSPNIVFRSNIASDFIRGVYQETPAVPTFTCNTFTGNESGIVVAAGAGGLVANNNNIAGNSTIGVQNDSANQVNAQSNWWGSASGPGPVGPGSGDHVSTNVDYSNFLTAASDCPPACNTNVALASYGATAMASSTYNDRFPAAGAIDGDHSGAFWAAGGGWNDKTSGVYPDWLEVDFNATQTISQIDVYTLRDQYKVSTPPITDVETFSLHGIRDFQVQYWNGADFVSVPGGVVFGNNRVRRRFVFLTPITTDRIRVLVTAAPDNLYSRIVELEAFSCQPAPTPTPTPTPTPKPCGTNVAAEADGSTANASSQYSANYPATGVIDGEHDGNNWGAGGGWNDAQRGVFPDTVQVNFNVNRTIDGIDVYTLKNQPNDGSLVNDTTPATKYGIKDFDVQYWTGASWATIGSATNNTLAKRSFLFTPVTTDRIRVVVNSTNDTVKSYSRVVEIEAFGCVVRSVTPGGTGGSFSTIQGAINASNPGDEVSVQPGTYDEDVNVNKADLKVIGASGAGSTTVRGPIGGSGSTFQLTAGNVTLAGFTITRLGNNTTDWNNAGLNTVGVAIQGQAVTGAVIRDNVITGNRTGIDINNSNGHTVRNNTIDFNRTGLIYRNQTDYQTVIENFITNNWTVGVLFLDASGGSNSPVQTALHSTFGNNNISGNWYGQVVDRQSGGSLPAPNTTNLKNFRGNWWGTTSPVVTTANSAEPGYAAQIPVAYGGAATPPGGQPDIAGPASANIQYLPLLTSGTDTNVETTTGRGTNGFQGVPNSPTVSPGNQQSWASATSSTATVSFVAGPGTPPLGAGSGQLSVGSDGDSGAQFRQTVFNGTRLDDLTELKYSTYTSNDGSAPTTGDQTAYIILNVDLDADGMNDTLLFFEPEYQHGYTNAVPDQGDNVLNTWQTWDALSGGWWSTTSAGGADPGAGVKPLSAIIAAFPNAVIHNSPTAGSLRLVAGFGAGAWDNFVGNADAFVIKQNGNQATYNFEQVP